MIKLALRFFLLSFACHAHSAMTQDSDHARKTLHIYKTIIEIDSSSETRNSAKVAKFLIGELRAAGFAASDIELVEVGNYSGLIVRYRGDGSSGRKQILLLGHMDVVAAKAEDWKRAPFKLTQDETYFYGRGTVDNKFGIAQLTATFIHLKKQGFVPSRDLVLVFSGDEESGMTTTRKLAYERADLANAAFALNSDAGGGDLDSAGNAISYSIQAAEKTYATWEITARNPGGHSSRPRPDNAIYDLADAIKTIQNYQFPVRWSDMTLQYFRLTGKKLGGELGKTMLKFADNPNDKAAADRLTLESSYVGSTRTTCVATMLRGGHAENALPQSATATINCRIFPGVSAMDVENALKTAVNNPTLEFKLVYEPTESPISELRPDVVAAVSKAVHQRYPDVEILAYMESGGTDGMHFRKAGIPTWAISGIFMDPDEMFAHGLNERVPIAAFYGALEHWSIILRELAGPNK